MKLATTESYYHEYDDKPSKSVVYSSRDYTQLFEAQNIEIGLHRQIVNAIREAERIATDIAKDQILRQIKAM